MKKILIPILAILCQSIFFVPTVYGQFQKIGCDNLSYRFCKDQQDLYLCNKDQFLKYDPVSGTFLPFFTKTNQWANILDEYGHLQFNHGKFYYYEAWYNPCSPSNCDIHYMYNGTTLDSMILYSGPSPSLNFGMSSTFIDSTLYFATIGYVYKSNYTAAGTIPIYTMPSYALNPDLVYEQIDDIKSFHSNLFMIEFHAMMNGNHCYLKKYNGLNWSTLDSSNGYITLHQGIDRLFYLKAADSAGVGIMKAAEITSSGTVNTMYISHSSDPLSLGSIVGSIQQNLFVSAIEKDTSGTGLFPDRWVLGKVTTGGLSTLNLSTYQNAMPSSPYSYWISGNFTAISNDTVMYFVADDTSSNASSFGKGPQIWVSDGTVGGTRKASIPVLTPNNDLDDAFMFNQSVVMCGENLYVMLDPDGWSNPLTQQLWKCDKYGNTDRILNLYYDDPIDYEDRYQPLAEYQHQLFAILDTNHTALQYCWFKNNDCALGTATTNHDSKLEVDIYPNPVTHELFIKFNQNDNNNADQLSIELIDLQGRKMPCQYKASGPNQYRVTMSGLAKGLYSLILRTNNKQCVKMLYKE